MILIMELSMTNGLFNLYLDEGTVCDCDLDKEIAYDLDLDEGTVYDLDLDMD